MKIDFSIIDRSRFHVNERSIPGLGDFVLVVPHKAMWDWNANELNMRSLLCRTDGTVVSAGFPKFFNFGENSAHDINVSAGLRDGRAHCLEKLDGSLIIRSVIDGQVHFRTRGCEIIASDMRDTLHELVKCDYPFLLDEALHADVSLLMEYVSPFNQIVVKYDKPQLVLLAAIDFSGDSLIVKRPPELGMRTPRVIATTDDVHSLNALVKALPDSEGVVVWVEVDGQMLLSKFKSAWYLRLHALRSQVTPRYLREYCYVNNVMTIEDLKRSLLNEGFDWEIVSYIEPMFNEIAHESVYVMEKKLRLDDVVSKLKSGPLSRKDIALKLKETCGLMSCPEMFSYAIASATGDDVRAQEIFDGLRLNMNVNQLRQLKKIGKPISNEVIENE